MFGERAHQIDGPSSKGILDLHADQFLGRWDDWLVDRLEEASKLLWVPCSQVPDNIRVVMTPWNIHP
jgi:hypothetical protein